MSNAIQCRLLQSTPKRGYIWGYIEIVKPIYPQTHWKPYATV